MKGEVLSVCIAFEQGYETGYERQDFANPYQRSTYAYVAWGYGHSRGESKRNAQDFLATAKNE